MSSSSIRHIYKILPAAQAPPTPLPAALPISALDQADGYVHASTSKQLLGTLKKFFAGEESVWILRLRYEALNKEGVVRWESTKGEAGAEGQEGCFPHLYNGLRVGSAEIDAVGEWKRGPGEWSSEGWPWGEEDLPR